MNDSDEIKRSFKRAAQLHAQGDLAAADRAYRALLTAGKYREQILQALVELHMQGKQLDKVIEYLVALTEEVPDRLFYYARLGALLDGVGETEAAIGHYQRLLARRPGLADAHFNIALLYKKSKRYDEAISSYEAAISHGIDNVQEVYSNLGVLYAEMRQKEKALQMYHRALEIDPEYIPALFNLAGLYEESGDRQNASDLYYRIRSLNPNHWESLSRLAHMKKVGNDDSDLIEQLQQETADEGKDLLARESLYFALGKAMDDLGRYEQAFNAYRAGNELGRQRYPLYEKQLVEQYFDHVIRLFDPEFIKSRQSALTAAPIFICGMFRSGSTLIEQVLAGHPDVTAGGELEYLPWLVSAKLSPYPERLLEISGNGLATLAEEYLSKLNRQFPGAKKITDKKPDNFLFLGLIRVLFPAARIIYTRRNPLDNCLSVYFQQLGGNLNYATDLENIAHYYGQHRRLMDHWQNCFSSNIFTLDYDKFVDAPEPVLHSMLEFLGLEWDDRCLDFSRADNLVQTASIWQVRDELHSNSSGRWRNYSAFAGEIERLLQ